MPRVIHFSINADDPQRAIRFYTDVFGWKIEKWGEPEAPTEWWMITTGPDSEPGINGGLGRRNEATKGGGINAWVCTVDVPDADEYAERIQKAGGTIEFPKMPIKGVGWMVMARDTEGNLFGVLEMDETAA